MNGLISHSNPRIVHCYEPPLRHRCKISILYDEERGLFANVLERGDHHVVPFEGNMPIDKDLAQIKTFLRNTHLRIQRNLEGIPVRVSAAVKGIGGMFARGKIRTLPVCDGYGIGSVIRKDRFLLPRYQADLATQHEALSTENSKKKELKAKVKDQEQATKEDDRAMEAFNRNIRNIESKIQELVNEISEISCDAGPKTFGSEELLPIDSSKSKLRTEHRAFASERMDHIIFSQAKHGNNLKEIDRGIQKVVRKIFGRDATSSSLAPASVLEDLAERISDLLEISEGIALVGSLITLSKVKTMDPIILRKGACSKTLIEGVDKYIVITEAALGGVFLGFGKYFEIAQEEEQSERDILAKMTTCSFISQGAIPHVARDLRKINLHEIYCSWKEILLADQHSGYPINLKARELKDVLIENEVLPLTEATE